MILAILGGVDALGMVAKELCELCVQLLHYLLPWWWTCGFVPPHDYKYIFFALYLLTMGVEIFLTHIGEIDIFLNKLSFF